jgi:beta-glucosidase
MTSMSVKWDGWLKVAEAGEYTFVMYSDDGGRLVIDGKTVIDDWKESGESRRIVRVRFSAGSWHRIEVQHFNAGGATSMDLRWSHGGNPPAILSPLNLYTKKPAAEKPAAQKPGK